jgi:hypothetical protein
MEHFSTEYSDGRVCGRCFAKQARPADGVWPSIGECPVSPRFNKGTKELVDGDETEGGMP